MTFLAHLDGTNGLPRVDVPGRSGMRRDELLHALTHT